MLIASLQGFVGNFFLLCNFTNRIRYIIALPVTIIMWYIATAILIALTISMELYVPPIRPQQSYTQGYVYAIIAACMYMIAAMLLMVNMLGRSRRKWSSEVSEISLTLLSVIVQASFWAITRSTLH